MIETWSNQAFDDAFHPFRNLRFNADSEDRIRLSEPRRRSIDEILKESARIFLTGAPGSGKSTLVSFLASLCAVGKQGLNWPDRALPFVVTVRELKDAAIGPE